MAGRYHLGSKPFLIEGAEKLLALGTRVGKFWLTPDSIAKSYPFNSQWPVCTTLLQLAQTPYFAELFALPFSTFILEAHSPVENGWQSPGQPESFYAKISQEFYELTAHLYRAYARRAVTFVLQHWEGDWLLRGRGGELWNPPPRDWPERCQRMVLWLKARQAGVTKARAELGKDAQCVVAHAAEVNRVVDAWQGIPTMTREVLPKVEVDLVSYSSYDALKDPLTLWKCLAEIRQFARPSPLYGGQSLYIGEIGIPENDQPERIRERWDEWLGVLMAADVRYVLQWELYCNEPSAKAPRDAAGPVTDPQQVRGFWLVKPDGSLSESGRYLAELWKRSAAPP